jgi:ribosomal protein S18 acetylase RimI-like enzyme
LLLRSKLPRGSDILASRTLGQVVAVCAVTELGQAEFLGDLDVMLEIYANAMEADAASLPGRLDLMRRHATFPAFRALRARSDAAGPAVGFAYGFHGESGQWWYDAVWAALSRALGMSTAAVWLADCLEIAEVHVRKEHQRLGIGSRLLTTLASGRGERTAVLSTPDRDTTARRLYRRMGFRDLLTGYSFPGGSPLYAVMGAELPLRPSTW